MKFNATFVNSTSGGQLEQGEEHGLQGYRREDEEERTCRRLRRPGVGAHRGTRRPVPGPVRRPHGHPDQADSNPGRQGH